MLLVPALFAALLLASSADGAALVRLVNTVPSNAKTANYLDSTYHTTRSQPELDRVGLSYVKGDTTTMVWTEFINPAVSNADSALNEGRDGLAKNYAYTHAMPPLRRYYTRTAYTSAVANTLSTSLATVGDVRVTGDVDRVAVYKATDINILFPDAAINQADKHPLNWDPLTQDILKSDGVGLYLSFAAGTYNFQPYSVKGAATAAAAVTNTAFSTDAVQQRSGLTSITFVDGKVYTLVIIGDGKWTVSAQAGSDFTIKVIEELTTPTTFGKAAVRWFHAIKANRDSTISVLSGDGTVSSGTTLASNIAFGAVSSYVDVNPSTKAAFTITTPSTIVAPTSSDKLETSHDLRAGLRATIICARHNEQAGEVTFCRMIPSRVVAYVRFVNDLAFSQQFNLGASGMVPLNSTKLSVYASSEMPRPDQMTDFSQTGAARTQLNHPLNIRGLYKILDSVAPGTASGYGEVFVPVLIMDFAITWTIVRDAVTATSPSNILSVQGANTPGAATLGVNTANTYNVEQPTSYFDNAAATAIQTYLGGSFHKRVHFIVKTEGGSTVAPNLLNGAPARAIPDNQAWLAGYSTLDVPVEPGTYITLAYSVVPNSAGQTVYTTTYANSRFVAALARLDRSVDDVSSGVAFNKFQLFLNPFFTNRVADASGVCAPAACTTLTTDDQQKYLGVLTFTSKSRRATDTNDLTTTVGTAADQEKWEKLSFVDLRRIESHTVVSTDVNGPLNRAYSASSLLPSSLGTGAYTVTFAPSGSTSATCYNTLPAFDVNGAAGDIINLFVLNTFACRSSLDFTKLKVLAVKTQSAMVTGNDAGTILNPGSGSSTSSSFLLSAAPATFPSAIIASLSVLLALIALVF